MFDDPDHTNYTEVALLSLKQDPRSVAAYTTHFYHLVTYMAWNKAVQIYLFCLGLNDEIKDELAQVDPHLALLSNIELCIQIDNQLFK